MPASKSVRHPLVTLLFALVTLSLSACGDPEEGAGVSGAELKPVTIIRTTTTCSSASPEWRTADPVEGCGEPRSVQVVVGPAGGVLNGGGGLSLRVPPGALSEPTTLTLEPYSEGAPSDELPRAQLYRLLPDDLELKVPATVTLPLPKGALRPALFAANPGSPDAVAVGNKVSGKTITAAVTSLRSAYVGTTGEFESFLAGDVVEEAGAAGVTVAVTVYSTSRAVWPTGRVAVRLGTQSCFITLAKLLEDAGRGACTLARPVEQPVGQATLTYFGDLAHAPGTAVTRKP
jgi:hypothetical protein